MKKKAGTAAKHIIRILIVLAVVVLIGGTITYFMVPLSMRPSHPFTVTRYPDDSALLTAEEAYADAEEMTAFLEDVHPVFLDEPTSEYLDSKEQYLRDCQRSMTVLELRILTSAFLSTLQDGHTRLSWSDSAALSVNWHRSGDELVAGSGSSLPEGARVLSLGGVPVSQVFCFIDTHFPAENQAALEANGAKNSRIRSVLEAAGASCAEGVVEVGYTLGGVSGEAFLSFQNMTGASADDSPVAEGREEDGVFIVTLRQCTLGDELGQTVAMLKDAVHSGITRVIIDVRDNPGGNSNACRMLLEAMGMKPGQYGSTIRFSREASWQNGYLRRSGAIHVKPDTKAKKNETVDLCVLVNGNTFSSATMLAVWVRDGGLGRIVGQPSANMPSSYGDIIGFQLTNSKLYGIVSHKQWIRPDASKSDERELTPDIVVPLDGDALQAALDALKS